MKIIINITNTVRKFPVYIRNEHATAGTSSSNDDKNLQTPVKKAFSPELVRTLPKAQPRLMDRNSQESSDDDEWCCKVCLEPYSNSKPREKWINCAECSNGHMPNVQMFRKGVFIFATIAIQISMTLATFIYQIVPSTGCVDK